MTTFEIVAIVLGVILIVLVALVVVMTTRTACKIDDQTTETARIAEESLDRQSDMINLMSEQNLQTLTLLSDQNTELERIRSAASKERVLAHESFVNIVSTDATPSVVVHQAAVAQRGLFSLEVDVLSLSFLNDEGYVSYDNGAPVRNAAVKQLSQEYRKINEPRSFNFKQIEALDASAQLRLRVYRIMTDDLVSDPQVFEQGPFVNMDINIEVEKPLATVSVLPGDLLKYTVTATNTGDIELTNVRVTSLITRTEGSFPLSVTDDGSGQCDRLPVGSSCVLVGTYVVEDEDFNDLQLVRNFSEATSDEVKDTVGASFSAQLNTDVLSPEPSMIPVVINFINSGDRSLTIDFTDSNGSDAQVGRYEISVKPLNDPALLPPGLIVTPAQYLITVGRDQSPVTVNHLTNGVLYEVRIRPINFQGKGPQAYALADRTTLAPISFNSSTLTDPLLSIQQSYGSQVDGVQLATWRLRNISPEFGYRSGDTIELTTGYPGGNDNDGTLSTWRAPTGVIGILGKGKLGINNRATGLSGFFPLANPTLGSWAVESTRFANRVVNASIFYSSVSSIIDLRSEITEESVLGQNSIAEIVMPFDFPKTVVRYAGQNSSEQVKFSNQLRAANVVPNLWTVSLRSDVAQYGYEVGDEIDLSSYIDSSDPQKALTTYVTKSEIGLQLADQPLVTRSGGPGAFGSDSLEFTNGHILIQRKDKNETTLAFAQENKWSIVFRVWPDAPLAMGSLPLPPISNFNDFVAFPHGLGRRPHLWRVCIKRTGSLISAPGEIRSPGYPIGSEIDVTCFGWNHRSDWIQNTWADANFIYVANRSADHISIVPRNQFKPAAVRIDPTKWEYVFRAW